MALLKTKSSVGFGIIEAIIYMSILAIVMSTSIYFIINIFNTYNLVFAQKEVMSNTQFAIDTIANEIKFSKNIYTPTSIANQDDGQITVRTTQNVPLGGAEYEVSIFADFYLDNGRIYVKREEAPAIPITSNQVKVTKLRFAYLDATTSPHGAQILIEAQFNSPSEALRNQSLIDLTTSTIIRYIQ